MKYLVLFEQIGCSGARFHSHQLLETTDDGVQLGNHT